MNPVQCSLWCHRQIFTEMEKLILSVAKWESRLIKIYTIYFSKMFVCVYVFVCSCLTVNEKILQWQLVYPSEAVYRWFIPSSLYFSNLSEFSFYYEQCKQSIQKKNEGISFRKVKLFKTLRALLSIKWIMKYYKYHEF